MTNANLFISLSCAYCMNAALLAIRIYSYLARKCLIPVCTCIVIDTYSIVIDIYIYKHKHKSITPYWVAAGYVQAWRKASDMVCALVCTCAGMMEYLFTINLFIQGFMFIKMDGIY